MINLKIDLNYNKYLSYFFVSSLLTQIQILFKFRIMHMFLSKCLIRFVREIILKRKKKQYYKNEIVSSLLTQIQMMFKFGIIRVF